MRSSKPGPKVRGCEDDSQVIVINDAADFCKPWPYEDVFANFLSVLGHIFPVSFPDNLYLMNHSICLS